MPCKIAVMWYVARFCRCQCIGTKVLIRILIGIHKRYWLKFTLSNVLLPSFTCQHACKAQSSNHRVAWENIQNARPVSLITEPAGGVCRLRSITLTQIILTCCIQGVHCCEVGVKAASDDSTEPATNWLWSHSIEKPLRRCYAYVLLNLASSSLKIHLTNSLQ